LSTPTGGTARKARSGVVYSLPVRGTQAVDRNQHTQRDHSDQQRIFNDIITRLLSPQTLQHLLHGRTIYFEEALIDRSSKGLTEIYTVFSARAQL
jgi:hypothetical protein